MGFHNSDEKVILSIVIPCYNEEETLEECVNRVLQLKEQELTLEIIIVDDCSTDDSVNVAQRLRDQFDEVKLVLHDKNQGKGAALRTGFKHTTGEFVAVQDADLEYDPNELVKLLRPLQENKADVVLGSRFLSGGAHRVLYFWHALGNKFLTLLSNMFTDLNLTDMETCYKVFRGDIIKKIEIQENRFGFEPEIIAKIAHMRLRIFEIGISYYGRTYSEGKKIGAKDGFRALYCIFRYNAHRAPIPIQFMIYLFIGGSAAIANLAFFIAFLQLDLSVNLSAPLAFFTAALFNYYLCIVFLFRHKAKWNTVQEFTVYWTVVGVVCIVDLLLTKFFIHIGTTPTGAKMIASLVGVLMNFIGRKYLVFPERTSGDWNPQERADG